MVEASLNGIWFVVAIGVLAASWRSSRRIKIALICAVALLFPIISISDDLSADRTLTDAMAIMFTVVLAMALIALARIRSTTFSPYVVPFVPPSDPRPPPQR